MHRISQEHFGIFLIGETMGTRIKKIIYTILFFAVMFSLGNGSAWLVETWNSRKIQPAEGNWGLGFGENGTAPTGNASKEELAQYNAYYLGDESTTEKKIYLTFDCGYENGNISAMLDALKKHNVSATFFVVGNFLETSPDIAKRIIEEGHTVGNHTYHHPDMSAISEKSAFAKEVNDVSNLFEQITGKKMSMFYRPPQGKYSTANLKMAQEMGYSTFFWSLAYVDWYEDKQPSHEEAFDKLLNRIHPGAIVLLHSTSKTNAEILDELLTKWEEMGYSFGTLDELVKEAQNK